MHVRRVVQRGRDEGKRAERRLPLLESGYISKICASLRVSILGPALIHHGHGLESKVANVCT